VLRKLLSRIVVGSGVTFLVRRDVLEITTGQFRDLEVFGEEPPGRKFPFVHLTPTLRPLEDWLDSLSERTGHNVYLDPRAAERGRTMVGARLYNVPLDLAVRLLAHAAELKVVDVENVLCVTPKENLAPLFAAEVARRNRDEAARRRSQLLDEGDLDPLHFLQRP
jgi:hypothetical protein